MEIRCPQCNHVMSEYEVDSLWCSFCSSKFKSKQEILEANGEISELARKEYEYKQELAALCKEKADNAKQEFLNWKENNKGYYLPIYSLNGCRGRSIEVFEDRVVITTDVTLGSILTANATDGAKTIFYSDVVGVQFKRTGMTIGYLQLETSSGQMNNKSSNQFSENTFTFEKEDDLVEEIKDFIIWKISSYKK